MGRIVFMALTNGRQIGFPAASMKVGRPCGLDPQSMAPGSWIPDQARDDSIALSRSVLSPGCLSRKCPFVRLHRVQVA